MVEDDLLRTATTNADGDFVFSPVTNWDYDNDNDLGPLDLYIVWNTGVNDGDPGNSTFTRTTVDFGDSVYEWNSNTYPNVLDGDREINGQIQDGDPWERAMWIFQTMRWGWERVFYETFDDPGPSIARWEYAEECFQIIINICDSSFFYPHEPLNGIFINDSSASYPDVVLHELGHHYMYNATDIYWFDLIDDYDCLEHNIYTEETRECAYTEGWATFFALVADPFQDQYVTFPSVQYDMENHNAPNPPTGDTVEGWVASAMYDLWDSNPDGYDQADFSFDDIWDVMKTTDPNSFEGFFRYWNEWKTYYVYDISGAHSHYGVQAIYQNTIDYNTSPVISLPGYPILRTPDLFPLNNILDLHDSTADSESGDSLLIWQITFLDSFCSPTNIDGQYVDIEILYPPAETRYCHVVIEVSDGIEATTGAFDVTIFVPTDFLYMPIFRWPEQMNPPGSNPYPPPSSSTPTPLSPPYP